MTEDEQKYPKRYVMGCEIPEKGHDDISETGSVDLTEPLIPALVSGEFEEIGTSVADLPDYVVPPTDRSDIPFVRNFEEKKLKEEREKPAAYWIGAGPEENPEELQTSDPVPDASMYVPPAPEESLPKDSDWFRKVYTGQDEMKTVDQWRNEQLEAAIEKAKVPDYTVHDRPAKSHYSGSVQPIDLIVAQGLDFLEGNVIKYVTRYKRKEGVADLMKAKQYLEWLIDREMTRES